MKKINVRFTLFEIENSDLTGIRLVYNNKIYDNFEATLSKEELEDQKSWANQSYNMTIDHNTLDELVSSMDLKRNYNGSYAIINDPLDPIFGSLVKLGRIINVSPPHIFPIDEELPSDHVEVTIISSTNDKWAEGEKELIRTAYIKELDWDFVEDNYPGYTTCELITLSSDLQVLVDNEYEEGSHAEAILLERYGGDINNPKVKEDLESLDKDLFKEAHENFLSKVRRK